MKKSEKVQSTCNAVKFIVDGGSIRFETDYRPDVDDRHSIVRYREEPLFIRSSLVIFPAARKPLRLQRRHLTNPHRAPSECAQYNHNR